MATFRRDEMVATWENENGGAPPPPSPRERARRLLADFPAALRERQFEVLYCPIFDLHSKQMAALEASLRWHHSLFHEVPFEDILSAANGAGLAGELDDWWMGSVASDLEELRTHRRFLPAAVRLHALHDPAGLLGRLRAWGEVRLPERPLLLVDEPGLRHGGDALVKALAEANRAGFSLAIDQFGAGYTRFSDLRRLSLAWFKLDRRLVARAICDEVAGALIHNLIQFAHRLGIKVVAPGISNQEQFWLMRNAGCDLGEGEEFVGPVPASAIGGMLGAEAKRRGLRGRLGERLRIFG